jgi:long-subunit fatty acid transport protein
VSARRAAVLLALLLLPARAAASPELDFGFGARSQALAGAGVAIAADPSAVFQNPSGLARARDVSVSLGYATVSYGLEDNDQAAALPTVNALEAGLVVPGAIRGMPVAFGLMLALPDGKLSRLREADPATPYWPLDDAGPRLVDIGTGFAARPLESLVLGAGIGFVASLRGNFGVQGNAVAADGTGSEYRSTLRHAVDADLTASRFPLLGIGYLPSELFSVGLAYRGAAIVEHRIQATLDGTLDLGTAAVPVHYAFRSRSTVGYMPAQLALGTSFRFLPAWLATVELDWQRYSAYRSPYTETASHAELDPTLGITVPDTAPAPSPPAHFHDRVVPRVGLEPRFALARSFVLTLRAGYAFEASPVPPRQAATRFLDLDRHLVSLGAGAHWQRPVALFDALELDLSLADAVGAARTASTTAGASADHATGHVLLAGASLRLIFATNVH